MARNAKQLLACQISKKILALCINSALLVVLIVPGRCADTAKDEETLNNASTVLQAMLNSNSVPSALLEKADCIVVLPSVKKFGFGVGGSGGRGPMTCRTNKTFSGKWSAPAMFSIGGASIGLQAGGSSTDFVLLLMDSTAVDTLLKGKTKLGNDIGVAAGPSGASATNTVGGADILTYGRTKGLFAGMSLGGATLQPDNDANHRLYGKQITAREIVIDNAVSAPTASQTLLSLLDSKVAMRRK